VVLERVAAYAEVLIDREILYPGREGLEAVEKLIAPALGSCAATAPGAAECQMALGYAYYVGALQATRPGQTYEGAPVILNTQRRAQSAVELLRAAADGMLKGAPRRALCLARLAEAMVLVSRATRSAEERERAVATAREAESLVGAGATDYACVHKALACALWWRAREGDRAAAVEHLDLAATHLGDVGASFAAALEWMTAGDGRASVHVERILDGLYEQLAGDGRLSIDLLEESTKWVGDGGVIGGHAEKPLWHRPSWMTESCGWGRKAAHAWARQGCPREAIEALERERLTVLDCGRAGDLRPLRWSELKQAGRVCPIVYIVPGESGGHALVLEGGREIAIPLPGLRAAAVEKVLFGNMSMNPDLEGVEYHRGTIVGRESAAEAGLTAAYAFWQMGGTDPRHDDIWLKPLEECGRWLGENLLAGLEKELVSERVVMIPAGPAALLPLQAAWLPDASRPSGRRYLTDSYEVQFSPSARVLLRPQREGMAQSLFAVGDPEPGGERALPFAAMEAWIAASTFSKQRVLEGAQATLPAVAAAMQEAEVVHLACHAYSNFQRPSDSAIWLAAGEALSLWDAVRMDLTGVRLVVLSACESGRTTRLVTDQMVSFSSGLLGAGARGVVATGWEIDDPAAAMLMLRFYHAWRVEGAAPPAALHQARIWLRDTTNQEKTYFCKTLLPEFGGNGTFDAEAVGAIYRTLALLAPGDRSYAHPHFWASFTYSGILDDSQKPGG
jgi:CHAT domain-containing protein